MTRVVGRNVALLAGDGLRGVLTRNLATPEPRAEAVGCGGLLRRRSRSWTITAMTRAVGRSAAGGAGVGVVGRNAALLEHA